MDLATDSVTTPSKEDAANPLDETVGEIAPVSRGDEGILEGVAIGESYGGDSSDDDEEGEGIVIHAGKTTAARRTHYSKYPGTYSGQKSYVRSQMTPGKDGVANLMDKLNGADDELKKLRFTRHMTAFDVDLNTLDEHPWRNKNVDLFDYFNYGFNEKTWMQYCEKQLKIRSEKGLGPHQYVPAPVVPKAVPKIGNITIIDTTKPDAAPIVMSAVNGQVPYVAPSNAGMMPPPPPPPGAAAPPVPPPAAPSGFMPPPPPPQHMQHHMQSHQQYQQHQHQQQQPLPPFYAPPPQAWGEPPAAPWGAAPVPPESSSGRGYDRDDRHRRVDSSRYDDHSGRYESRGEDSRYEHSSSRSSRSDRREEESYSSRDRERDRDRESSTRDRERDRESSTRDRERDRESSTRDREREKDYSRSSREYSGSGSSSRRDEYESSSSSRRKRRSRSRSKSEEDRGREKRSRSTSKDRKSSSDSRRRRT